MAPFSTSLPLDLTKLLDVLAGAKLNVQRWDLEVGQAENARRAGNEVPFLRSTEGLRDARKLYFDLRAVICDAAGWPDFGCGLGIEAPPQWQHDPETGEDLWLAAMVLEDESVSADGP